MMKKTSAEMTRRVSTIVTSRRPMYRANIMRRSLREEEFVHAVDAEIGGRLKGEEGLLRHVVQPIGDDDRLQLARHRADAEDGFGVDGQHLLPDASLLGVVARREPLLVEIEEVLGLRQIDGLAALAARLRIFAPGRPGVILAQD